MKFDKIIIVLFLLFTIAFAGCAEQQITTGEEINFTVYLKSQGNIDEQIEITTTEGKSVFQALVENESVQLQYDEYSTGVFVTGINALVPKNDEYLGLYVNNEYAQVGIGDLEATEGMNIEFRIEKISESFLE